MAKSDNLEIVGRRLRLLLNPINALMEAVGLSRWATGSTIEISGAAMEPEQSDIDLRRMIDDVISYLSIKSA